MPRKAKTIDIPAIGELNRQAGQLSLQLARALKKAIQRGELKAGDPLPSTRTLASSLRLARGTVIEAFEQLIAEGFFEAVRGSGTRVANELSELSSPVTPRGKDLEQPPALSAQAERYALAGGKIKLLEPVPFAVSVPAGSTLPDDIWRRLGNRIRAKGPGAPSGYASPAGALPLREAIAEYVRKSRSVHCTPEQVIIAAGTQQGLYLSSQVLLDAGEKVWVEDPAYHGITSIFETTGRQAQMIRVPLDVEGLNVTRGIELCADAKAAFVTPSHQYPVGMPMSMARRLALIDWAKANRSWIVEDDYDTELRYAGHPFPSLQGLSPERVIYLGTFSKILFPSLRLGYVVVPEPLVDAYLGARMLIDRHPPSADQYVLASFMAEGHLDRHIRRMRGVYAEKREVLINAVIRHMAPELAVLQPGDQGMHMVLWLHKGIRDVEVVQYAIAAGVSVRAVSPMYSAGNERSGLILGLGGFTDEAIIGAVKKLAAIIQRIAP
ncbi:PLP-dependent aminotransferase family protein [Rouxiella badensis]|uniref:DNA-binding protein n=1 Tax=Rouxiella badensis TaxID=1646377 RepID=A0A1X0WFB6_9GAMM|nr:PLP-dependent aminotransferase family protein [Rouxiella badensis]MCC3731474.1 PLP-dependent aminotransferase family protein [Rouxiella badensis]MCC3756863.1 PLP-dependent aminotransferase family protein [Rouxiella badensis]ORJ25462.1 DNA-binding protein [Rouxiella badensis]WAT10413.1 PLP-dependent aminotransferase family protein [Rouxiella badensis]